MIYEYSAFVWPFWSLWPWRSNQRHWLNFLSHLIILGPKKNLKVIFFIWSLMWPSKKFFWPFHFCWDILCVRSLLGCSNPISKFNIIPKGKWFKFSISNHSDKKRSNQKEIKVLYYTKAELLQLNRTQFPSLGIVFSKKVGNQKN